MTIDLDDYENVSDVENEGFDHVDGHLVWYTTWMHNETEALIRVNYRIAARWCERFNRLAEEFSHRLRFNDSHQMDQFAVFCKEQRHPFSIWTPELLKEKHIEEPSEEG
jgi:hypothetical protein